MCSSAEVLARDVDYKQNYQPLIECVVARKFDMPICAS